MSSLCFDTTGRCPIGAACMSCGVDSDGARVITDCPAGPDTCGAPAGTPCEPFCASHAAEPEPGPMRVAILGTGAGALCVTLCWGCSANGLLPTLTGDAARRLIIEHREHSGEVTR